MKKVLFVFGTRPEAIKMAPVVKALKARAENFEVRICVTGQHRQMLDQLLGFFDIRPDYDLDLMKPGQTLYEITTRALTRLEPVLKEVRPDVVLVQGDTTTAFVGALAAFYEQIEIGHVEAGLRTGDKYAPFPEEANRSFISVLSDYNFAPTAGSRANLLRCGCRAESIYVTGNTVIDALFMVLERLKDYDPAGHPELSKLDLSKQTILVTGHRRENFGAGFLEICQALKQLAERYPQVEIVYPVHLNPNVQEPVRAIIGGVKNIRLLGPLDYADFVYLMNRSHIVLTDSGGVQEEAPSLGKPVLVMRDKTERPEAVAGGGVKLVGPHGEAIVREVSRLLDDPQAYRAMSEAVSPYGDGKAAARIAEALAGEPFEPFEPK
ncbi:MAG: UDP-N-acetylglucosamine 2-epimerase (non-hydrolyzing) [Anaerolineaceae bacterium]|nr:UDP-N-acetylglucosamine 2-epimerase (non-hydrolyzing) [Anaerolineaceae bacterium]